MSNVSDINRNFICNIPVVLFLLLVTSAQLFSQETDIKFTRISVEDGLSHLVTNFIDQDESGFIWIGTHDGLNRFDGYQFKTYYKTPDNPSSLSDNIITCFLQENKEVIWIGTDEGLNKFNLLNNNIDRYVNIKSDSTSLSNNLINSLVKDELGFLWIGTDDGLNKFNPKTGTFKRFYPAFSSSYSENKNRIQKLYIDTNNSLWVKTIDAVYRMDLTTKVFQKVIQLSISEKIINPHYNFGMFQTVSGKLLIGSGSGMYVYNYDTHEISVYTHDSNNSKSLSNNIITSILQDDQGVIWIGTVDGLNKFDERTGAFDHYKQNIADSKSLSNNIVTSIFQDKSGAIWVGTFGSGINRFNPFSKNFNYFKTPGENIKNPNDKSVWAVLEDRNKNIWWGTNHGLYVINEKSGEIKFYGVNAIKNKGIVQEFVGALYEDSFGNLWIGTDEGISVLKAQMVTQIFDANSEQKFIHIYSKERILRFLENTDINKMWVGVFDQGLLEFDMEAIVDPEKRIPKNVLNNIPGLETTKINITEIFKKDSVLWLGSKQGMLRFDINKNEIKRYQYREGDEQSISHNKVYSIQEGKGNVLWLATYGGGLNKFNIDTEESSYYTTKNGLLNNGIYNLLIDNENKIWVSTNNGLSKFDPTTEIFKNYDENDGVQGNEFNQGAFYKSKTGRMYFGGNEGFNAFYPNKIDENQVLPEVVLTDFLIFNTIVKPKKKLSELGISGDSNVILDKDINETEKIKLSHTHSVFSIEFAASHYINPKRNVFEYKLEGFDENWVSVNSRNRKATYTNLDPGKYVFKARSANKDQVWNKVSKELKIEISPPFWGTNWFYFLSILGVLAIIYIVLRIRIGQINLQHFKKQNELKTTMLKEIHHRVKNNLQIVNSLLRMQSSTMDDMKTVEVFKKVQSRILSMSSLHEEMYKTDSLNKIETKKHFEKLIRDLVVAYKLDKDISLRLDIDPFEFNMDTLIPLGLIINELVINSLKHAFVGRDKGMITVLLKKTKARKEYRLQVNDDGIGMGVAKGPENMGAKLIKSFVRQLKGTVKRLDDNGTVYEIKFKAL